MLKTINISDLTLSPFTAFDKRWMVLSAGDFAKCDWNSMTVSWGFIGTMWNKPAVQIVVRPQRHTREFLDKYEAFTLCSFPEKYRPALQILGSKSGRNCDKVAESGLRPTAASAVAAPIFEEADLVLECRKLFRQTTSGESLLDPSLNAMYPENDYHVFYIGEVVAVRKAV